VRQNHDQVGNRARGDRLCHIVDPGLAKAAAALILCAPFVPMLFMGEEWASSSPFPYSPDRATTSWTTRSVEVESTISSGLGWDSEEVADPIAESTFASACLRWDEIYESQHREMQTWYAPSSRFAGRGRSSPIPVRRRQASMSTTQRAQSSCGETRRRSP